MAFFNDSDEESLDKELHEEDESWQAVWNYDDQNQASCRGQTSTNPTNANKSAKNDSNGKENKGKNTFPESSSSATEDVSSTTIVSRMQLNDNKAGMDGLDKEKINAIIHEASKGSKYYENEVKKEEQVNRRLLEQKQRLDQLTQQQLDEGLRVADQMLVELERTRDLSRSIVHVDMDMFYAAVEMRDDPSLKSKPMAVGGNSMLSTSNYIARKFGVRAAMPGFIGRKLCPDLVIVPANFAKYTDVSNQVRGILAQYDANFSPMSLDEAYLDFTDHLKERNGLSEEERTFPNIGDDLSFCACRIGQQKLKTGSQESSQCMECCKPISNCQETKTFGLSVDDAVMEMRHRIHLTTRLTASAGIAPNTMIAKVCSDKNKPNGQHRVHPSRENVMEFIKDLPIRKVCGIGKVSEKMLSGLGVVTCTDLFNQRAVLYHLYSNISFNYFMRICRGLGSSRIERDGERKSISNERTFSEISKPQDLYEMCSKLSQALEEDLQKEQIVGKTVTLKIKNVNFEVKTKAQTLHSYTQSYEQINEAAKTLLKTEIQACAPQPLRLRLMGVRLSNLCPISELGKQKQNMITSFLRKPSTKSSNTEFSQSQSKELVTPEACVKQEERHSSGVNIMPTDDKFTVSKATEHVTCPVCNRPIKSSRMDVVHEHINFCLERGPPKEPADDLNSKTNLTAEKHEETAHDNPLEQMQKFLSESLSKECSKPEIVPSKSIHQDSIEQDSKQDTQNTQLKGVLSETGLNNNNKVSNFYPSYENLAHERIDPTANNDKLKRKTSSKFGLTYIPLFTKKFRKEEKQTNDNVVNLVIEQLTPKNCAQILNSRTIETSKETDQSDKEICAKTDQNMIENLQNSNQQKISYVKSQLQTPLKSLGKLPNNDQKRSSRKSPLKLPSPTNGSPSKGQGSTGYKPESSILQHFKKSRSDIETQVLIQTKDEADVSDFIRIPKSNCTLSMKNDVNQVKDCNSKPQDPVINASTCYTKIADTLATNNISIEKSMYTCPVCGMKVSSSLDFFNKHIDNCLSKQAIHDLVGKTPNRPISSCAKKSPSSNRPKNPKDAKRRKLDSGQSSMASFISTSKSK